MTQNYNAGSFIKCPHCGEELEECPAEDYVVPNRVGSSSISAPSDCYECDGLFTVEHLGEGKYLVKAIAGKYVGI
jgi:uncharacterized protein with PIN domain